MVSIRKVHTPIRPGFEEWLSSLSLSEQTKQKLRDVSATPEILLIGQEMVEILHELNMDDETLQASLVYPYCQMHELSDEDIVDEFGEGIQKLICGVRRMDAIKSLHGNQVIQQSEGQIDNIRRMLVDMVEDVRTVLIKLAERVCALQSAKNEEEETRVLIARECATIYAPLANRLGIGQLKWELEDLSFRYLHPTTYKEIAGWLEQKRSERQQYIEDFVSSLQASLNKDAIRAKVYGRPKHIFSIYKKMQKKDLTFEQLFDIRAVRIIADRLQDCYSALGVVHANWKHLPKEFDDYVATPKSNGYQSIHTVVSGPEERAIEIQIRTQQMHNDAELGVAAHWRYKEGSQAEHAGHDGKVNWLRKILAWQEEVAESGNIVEELRSQVFDDRVYVFTPNGDVIDLPMGSTPLDFAYYIHSNVGHRCIGAKVASRIVPFTYQLQTGDQVEILTGKQPNPSRDWMHPGLGYVHSSRARAKIHTYFKKQDKDKNQVAGKELLERELNRANLSLKDAEKAVERFNVKTVEDLHAGVGGGDIRLMQVINYLLQLAKPVEEIDPRLRTRSQNTDKRATKDKVVVLGVGNLMTQIANCCQPLPGDEIVGYITQGRGVSVHRSHCEQFANLINQHPEREIEVNWSSQLTGRFQSNVDLFCDDRDGMLRDITTTLANQKVTLLGVNSLSNTQDSTAKITLMLELENLPSLSKTITSLKSIKGISSVQRHDK